MVDGLEGVVRRNRGDGEIGGNGEETSWEGKEWVIRTEGKFTRVG